MMTNKVLNCEEEQIHLCGRIQNFGYLILFDLQFNCIAISENSLDWLNVPIQDALNKNIDYFLAYLDFETNDITAEDFTHTINNEFTTFKVKLNNLNYQLTVYVNGGKIFFEFEENDEVFIKLNQLNEFQVKFDNNEDTWQTLCDNIYEILDFDRIMVYQFLEDSSGVIIAEHTKENTESLLRYRYPDFDIPIQARELYTKNLARQTPDIYAKTSRLIGLEAKDIDLTQSHIRALAPVHIQYLKNFGAVASASFSIIIDHKLWGLLTCHNASPKYISYNQRSLCLFMTQYAANTHLIKEQRLNFTQNIIISEVELDLKEKLHQSLSIEETLSEFASSFMTILNANGLIIKFQDHTIRCGETPDNDTFKSIHQKINEKANEQPIFTTHAWDREAIHSKNYAGVARLNFDKEHKYTIYFFRKEVTYEEKWAGIPEKQTVFSEEKKAHVYSPRSSFQAWRKEVKGQSEKWSSFDLTFLKRIHKQIQHAIFQKLTKVHDTNGHYAEMNNDLETYTHQLAHDLKNPLTIIKINAQFIEKHPNLPKELSTKFSSSIIEAATLINDIMDKTLESTKPTPTVQKYKLVETDKFIDQIIEQAVKKYEVKNFQLKIGELFPIYGEKTLLHQLFMNLINNAIKFSSLQDLTLLEIHSTQNKNHTIYYIKDNGIGIAENEKSEMFSMFKRLSNAQNFEGTGVGMSIVKRIVDQLDADISIDSQIGKGTTFKIIFKNEQ